MGAFSDLKSWFFDGGTKNRCHEGTKLVSLEFATSRIDVDTLFG
jgi:hypothetical protein